MPIMSVKEFEKRTKVGLFRGDRLKAIADRLKGYHADPSVFNLRALKEALDRWQSGHRDGDRDSWRQDRRNQVPGKGNPIEDLSNWVDRKLVEPGLIALRDAALDIEQAYGDMMDHTYRRNLIEMFLGNPIDSTEPVYCFYYWDDDARWTQRLNTVGAPPKTNAFCMPMHLADKDPTIRGSALVRIKADFAPANRQIEFSSKPGIHHSVAHELLHWCTHETFEDYSHNMADKTLGKFFREGITEWLTRNALDEWDRGGYADFFPIWKDLVDDGNLSLNELILPYFHGVGVQTFCDKVKPSIEANEQYQLGVGMEKFAAKVAALARAPK